MTFERKSEITEESEGQAGFEPSYSTFAPIPHYWGTPARQFLISASVLLLLASPLYADNLHLEFPFEVIGALIAVGFAALTNPHTRWVSVGDAVIAGTGVAVYAAWGIFGYDAANPLSFVLRVAIAVVFLFAFYFSMKTVRAFTLHQIGKWNRVDEFDERVEKDETIEENERDLEREREAFQKSRRSGGQSSETP
jgi:hypothetical protein